jgi:hypothetical protein
MGNTTLEKLFATTCADLVVLYKVGIQVSGNADSSVFSVDVTPPVEGWIMRNMVARIASSIPLPFVSDAYIKEPNIENAYEHAEITIRGMAEGDDKF